MTDDGEMNLRPFVLPWIALSCLVASVSGCGDSSTTTRTTTTKPAVTSSTTTTSTTAAPSSSTSSGPTTSTVSATSVSVFLIRGETVGPARRPGTAQSPASSAVQALLDGPGAADRAAGLSTAIPVGTRLLGLNIAEGTATVDLSGDFGRGGGSLSMQERVAQVVYTLTQFPSVQRVVFHVDGKAVTALGGEGLVLTRPQTRADWESMTPAILLESPLPGDRLTSPLEISGTADTFEATFQVRLLGPTGTKLYEHFVMATSGTGTRGTFRQSISFTASAHGAGTLEVYEVSAKDGSEIHSVKIPVEI